MKYIISEVIIPMGEFKTIFSDIQVKVSVRDDGPGPYLAIEGINDVAVNQEYCHEFYLGDNKEIDEFCKILKTILKQAEEAK